MLYRLSYLGAGEMLSPDGQGLLTFVRSRTDRTDELRSGLSVIAGAYRDAAVQGTSTRPDSLVRAVHRVHDALEALERNPNEALLLQALLLQLPSLPG